MTHLLLVLLISSAVAVDLINCCTNKDACKTLVFSKVEMAKALLILLIICLLIVLSVLCTLFETDSQKTLVSKLPTTILCQRKTNFYSNRNATIDFLLQHHHLENIPFKKEEVVRAFVGYSENYNVIDFFKSPMKQPQIAPKYSLATCNIPKILSTVKTALFWLLYDEQSFRKHNVSLNTVDWDVLFQHLDSARWLYSSLQNELNLGFTMFMVHRHPVERFISGYVDKCVNNNYCFHCERNITCFAEEQYKRLVLFSNDVPIDKDHGMEDFHFAPQTWFCRLNETFYDWRRIKYEASENLELMVGEIMSILEDSCVEPRLLKFIKTQLMEGKTYHSTKGSSSRNEYETEVETNPALIKLLLKMYYYDYIAFGYPLPVVDEKN